MICIARTFGAPESVPAGKAARTTSSGGVDARDAPAHLAHDVHHVRVALDLHLPHELHAPDLGHAPHVVPPEVDEHHVLGALLRIGQELALERQRPPPASCRAGACRRAGARVIAPSSRRTIVSGLAPAICVRVALAGRGREIEEVHVRARVEHAHRAVDVERVAPARAGRGTCARATIWNASPAAMYSCARRTLASYFASSTSTVDVAAGCACDRAARAAAAAPGSSRSARARSTSAASLGGDGDRLREASKTTIVAPPKKRASGARRARSPAGDLLDRVNEVPREVADVAPARASPRVRVAAARSVARIEQRSRRLERICAAPMASRLAPAAVRRPTAPSASSVSSWRGR